MGEGDSDRFQRQLVKLRRWRPPSFQVGQRPAGTPPLHRWESLLRAERSTAHQLVRLASRSAMLRRLLRLPEPEQQTAVSLEERERQVARTAAFGLARLLSPAMRPMRTNGLQAGLTDRRPWLGPLLDREVDRSLALLRNVPFEEIQERGWHLQPNTYAFPLNDAKFLRGNPDLWIARKLPAGIEWDLDGQQRLAARLAAYAHELADVPEALTGRPGDLAWDNGVFGKSDILAYYGLVRELQPRHVIEVGAGWSTLALARAVAANPEPTEVMVIEPAPNGGVLGELPRGWQLDERLLQHVDAATFDLLEAGDLLFYDGSHVSRTGSDLNWLLFEVMPRLARGVWVHFHDIMWPDDYLPEWVLTEGFSWNEQYLLQAFLMHNDTYRLRLAVHALEIERAALGGDRPVELSSGGSVWIEKVA